MLISSYAQANIHLDNSIACLDRAGIQYAWTALVYVFPFAVSDRLKAVPVTSFTEHVQGMHEDKDKDFELEYLVSWSTLADRLPGHVHIHIAA